MGLDTAVQLATLVALVSGFVLYFVDKGKTEANVGYRVGRIEDQQSESIRELKELRGISTDLLRTVAVGAETFNGLKTSIAETRDQLEDIEKRLRAVEIRRDAMLKS